jgi:hypothetical protein
MFLSPTTLRDEIYVSRETYPFGDSSDSADPLMRPYAAISHTFSPLQTLIPKISPYTIKGTAYSNSVFQNMHLRNEACLGVFAAAREDVPNICARNPRR